MRKWSIWEDWGDDCLERSLLSLPRPCAHRLKTHKKSTVIQKIKKADFHIYVPSAPAPFPRFQNIVEIMKRNIYVYVIICSYFDLRVGAWEIC